MKKTKQNLASLFIIALVLSLLCLAGCKKDPEPDDMPDVSPTEVLSPTEVPSATPKPTETPAPTATPIPEPTATPTPTPLPEITEVFTKSGFDNIYDAPVTFEGNLGFIEYDLFDDSILLFFSQLPSDETEADLQGEDVTSSDDAAPVNLQGEDVTSSDDEAPAEDFDDGYGDPEYYEEEELLCIRYNPVTSEQTRVVFADIYPFNFRYIPINSEIFSLYDYSSFTYHLLDRNLETVRSFTAPVESYETGIFDTAGEILYYIDPFEDTLNRYDVLSGENTVLAEDSDRLTSVSFEDDVCDSDFLEFCSYYYDGYSSETRLFRYDLATGVFTDYHYDGSEIKLAPDSEKCMIINMNPYYVTVCNTDELFAEPASDEDGTEGSDGTEGEAEAADGTEGEAEGMDGTEGTEGEAPEEEAARVSIGITSTEEVFNIMPDWEARVVLSYTSYYQNNREYYELKCYSMDTGKVLSTTVLSYDTYASWISFFIDPNKHLMYFSNHDGEDFNLSFWDYLNDTTVDNGSNFARLNEIPAYLDEHRKAIEDKYNVFIYLGSEISASPFDYDLAVTTDHQKMDETLTVIEEVLEKYPAGFFEQIKMQDIKTLGIYLCGGFTKTNSYSSDNTIALAITMGYERALALDIFADYNMHANIAHEISHWIDKRINMEADFGRCTDFEDKWLELSPDDSSYRYSYVDGWSSTKYVFSDTNIENAYFTDSYSLTYPTEDRARLFEHLMFDKIPGIDYDEDASEDDDDYYYSDDYEYFKSEHLRAKLRYYFEMIREAFDDSTWPEQTYWEERLEKIEQKYAVAEETPVEE